jgi:hypothetical protein
VNVSAVRQFAEVHHDINAVVHQTSQMSEIHGVHSSDCAYDTKTFGVAIVLVSWEFGIFWRCVVDQRAIAEFAERDQSVFSLRRAAR